MAQLRTKPNAIIEADIATESGSEWHFDSDRRLAAGAFQLGDGWTAILIFDGSTTDLPLLEVQIACSGPWIRTDEASRTPGSNYMPDPFADWLQDRIDAYEPPASPPAEGLVVRRLNGLRLGGLLSQARRDLTPPLLRFGLGMDARKGPRRRVSREIERELARLSVRYEELQPTGKALALLADEEGSTYSAMKSRLDRARDLRLLTRPGRGQRGIATATPRARSLI